MRGVLLLLALSIFLLGCSMPSFQHCCLYANASNDDVCILQNGTDYSAFTDFCDMDGLFCNVTLVAEGGDGEEHEQKMQIPVCPQEVEYECNTYCAVMFCGDFGYDPRPDPVISAGFGSEKSSEEQQEESQGMEEKTSVLNLYNAECRVMDLTPEVARGASNSGKFVLNIFRFGVGDSFQDFEEASYYFPLTDRACTLTQGAKDRFTNYAIPNWKGGDELCIYSLTHSSGAHMYACGTDFSVRYPNYYQCALACSFEDYGLGYADPYNPYPTEHDGEMVGNPFSYGISSSDPGFYQNTLVLGDSYRSEVGDDVSNDNFQPGFTYYGERFSKDYKFVRGDLLELYTAEGFPVRFVDSFFNYYYGEETDTMYYDRNAEGNTVPPTVFLTVEENPRMAYPFILTTHSEYNKQLWTGHLEGEGEWAGGAEWECDDPSKCMSGFCNKVDYSRGTCKLLPGHTVYSEYKSEITGGANAQFTDSVDPYCGCTNLRGKIECPGLGAEDTLSWDRPDKDVLFVKPLAAPVNEHPLFSLIYSHTSLPSKSAVVKGVNEWYHQGDALVIFLGGESRYPTHMETDPTRMGSDYFNNLTLTIPMVLSPYKWPGCSAYDECGRFYNTFVDACMPTYAADPYAYVNKFLVCYSPAARARNGGVEGYVMVDYDGEPKVYETSVCDFMDEEGDDDLTVWEREGCYLHDLEGECWATAESALVILSENHTIMRDDGTMEEIPAFGYCRYDVAGEDLDITTYGFCEGCSYLTLAKEEIVPLPMDEDDPGYPGASIGNKYCPVIEYSTPNARTALIPSMYGPFDKGFAGTIHEHDYPEESYSECSMPDFTEIGYQNAWPEYLPDAYYLKRKMESMLKRNVMPVIFAVDSGLYRGITADDGYELYLSGSSATHPYLADVFEKEYLLSFAEDAGGGAYFSEGVFLADSVMDQGAAIIVTGTVWFTESLGMSEGMVVERSNAVRFLCPNCLTAIGTGYVKNGNSYEEKLRDISRLFDYRNATTGDPLYDDYSYNFSCTHPDVECSEALVLADVFAVNWTLNKGNSHCEIEDEEERFGEILWDEMEFGSKTLARFGKPVVVSDFSIVREAGGCWDEESAGRFLVYLGMHTAELVQSGHIGLIYSDWTKDYTGSEETAIRFDDYSGVDGYRGDFYKGVFNSARLFSGYDHMTLFSEAGIVENCTCMPCGPTDPPALCNGKFRGTGPLCEGYEPADYARWPENCFSEAICISGDELSLYKIYCNAVYQNGTEETFDVDGTDILDYPYLYKDVIASIGGSGKVPCITAGGSSLTYISYSTEGTSAFPLLFRSDGNLQYQCMPPTPTDFQVCDYSPPISDRRLYCEMSMEGIPPLSGYYGPVGIGGIGGGVPLTPTLPEFIPSP